jgi:DNA-binding NarL/FixJ family response regulator
MISVLIADDHAVVRRGLRQILSEESDIRVEGEAASAAEMIQQVRQRRYDVVILDIGMPGRSGLDALKDLREIYPRLPVLVLSVHPEDQFAMRVLKAGGSGYMTKESAPEELLEAVRRVSTGGRYISSSFAARMATILGRTNQGPSHESLSDRELEVLLLIATGDTVSGIATRLEISVKTVSTYRTRILEKLGLRTNAELTYYAIKHELIA